MLILCHLKEINRFVSNIGNIRFNIILLNVVGNVVAFIPLGFLLPVYKQKSWSGGVRF